MPVKKLERARGKACHRLNLALSPVVYKKLTKLKKQTTASSLTEVIARALALYESVVDQEKNGAHLVVKKGNRTSDVLVLHY